MSEIGILRRIGQGPLRLDGVTDFQRGVIAVMRAKGWVTLNDASCWDLTPTGRQHIERKEK